MIKDFLGPWELYHWCYWSVMITVLAYVRRGHLKTLTYIGVYMLRMRDFFGWYVVAMPRLARPA